MSLISSSSLQFGVRITRQDSQAKAFSKKEEEKAPPKPLSENAKVLTALGTYTGLGILADQYNKRILSKKEAPHHDEHHDDHHHEETHLPKTAQQPKAHIETTDHDLHNEVTVSNMIKLLPSETALEGGLLTAAYLATKGVQSARNWMNRRKR